MKKGVWNVENPLALSELFSDGIFLLPVSRDIGAVKIESTSTDSEPNLQSENTSKTASNSLPNSNSTISDSVVIANSESSNNPSTALPIMPKSDPTTIKLPKWEGVAIVNLIYEENQFEPMNVIKKIMQAVKIPGVAINGQTVKFISISKGSTSLTTELLERYIQHFSQVRIVFWIKNSSLENAFQMLNHPRILMVDMPSVMVSSEEKKRGNWSAIKTFFGM